ncbi:MAG: MBL fold metallo-hydrolase [Thermodesulfobacteriota bacterium]|nr:MBL fold metallo-hydrolase [Thermodesulfobacteriota bacterium]
MKTFKNKQFGDIDAFFAAYSIVGKPFMGVYIYRVGDVLIDTGLSHLQNEILAGLEEKPLSHILLTHYHEDHSGNAGALFKAHGATVWGHSYTARMMKNRYPMYPYRHLMWGRPGLVKVTPYPESIDCGKYRFIPVHTPGHSPDHTAFLEPSYGWLFSGDLYLGDRARYARPEECVSDEIQSLRKVLDLDFEWLMCAHNPIPEKGKERIARKLNFWEDLFGEVGQLMERGDSDSAILRRMRNREDRLVKWLCMGDASFANIVRACIRERRENVS